jgi:hypothetical protein
VSFGSALNFFFSPPMLASCANALLDGDATQTAVATEPARAPKPISSDLGIMNSSFPEGCEMFTGVMYHRTVAAQTRLFRWQP